MMAENKDTKTFEFDGVKLDAVKMKNVKIKVGVLRAVEAETIEGLCSLVKILTGATDEIIDNLEMVDMESVITWATDN